MVILADSACDKLAQTLLVDRRMDLSSSRFVGTSNRGLGLDMPAEVHSECL